MKVIAVTSNQRSPLAELADITLFLPAGVQNYHRLANFSSQACMTYVLDVIYSMIFVRTTRGKKASFID